MSDDVDKAQNYNAVVGGVGYVGLFSLLSFKHDLMQPKPKAFAALCLLMSVTVYVAWVVGTMICRTLIAHGAASSCAERLNGLWVGALFATIVPAAAAAVVLAYSYLRVLCIA